MRTYAQRFALLKYNAERCEKSKHPRCSCACGGTKHGQPHGGDWLAVQANRLADEVLDDLEKRDTDEGRPGLFT